MLGLGCSLSVQQGELISTLSEEATSHQDSAVNHDVPAHFSIISH